MRTSRMLYQFYLSFYSHSTALLLPFCCVFTNLLLFYCKFISHAVGLHKDNGVQIQSGVKKMMTCNVDIMGVELDQNYTVIPLILLLFNTMLREAAGL